MSNTSEVCPNDTAQRSRLRPRADNRKRNLLIASGVFILLAIAIGLGGFIAGHGWFFSNLPAEHRVDKFFTAIEAKDFNAAYAIYTNNQLAADPNIPRYSRFTEDWTTESPIKAPITSHHVEISKTEGSGTFGTGIIVAVHLNQVPTCTFLRVERSDHTITWPAPHEIGYSKCNNVQ